MTTYKVNIGLDFPPLQRREPGDTVTDKDLPKTSIPGLLQDGVIEPVKSKKKEDD